MKKYGSCLQDLIDISQKTAQTKREKIWQINQLLLNKTKEPVITMDFGNGIDETVIAMMRSGKNYIYGKPFFIK